MGFFSTRHKRGQLSIAIVSVNEAPTQSSDLHRRLFTSGGLPAQRQQGGPQSAAPHSSAGAKRRTSARGGEWGEQTLQQACSQAYPGSAMCVQNFDDSLNSAIRITYRISLRSSSLREPRYPLLKVVKVFGFVFPSPSTNERKEKKVFKSVFWFKEFVCF